MDTVRHAGPATRSRPAGCCNRTHRDFVWGCADGSHYPYISLTLCGSPSAFRRSGSDFAFKVVACCHGKFSRRVIFLHRAARRCLGTVLLAIVLAAAKFVVYPSFSGNVEIVVLRSLASSCSLLSGYFVLDFVSRSLRPATLSTLTFQRCSWGPA